MVKRRCASCIPNRTAKSFITKPIDGQCPLPYQEYVHGYFRYTPQRKYVAPYCRMSSEFKDLSLREMGFLDQEYLLPETIKDLDILDYLLVNEATILSEPYKLLVGGGLDQTLTEEGLLEIKLVNTTVSAAKMQCIRTTFSKMPTLESSVMSKANITSVNSIITNLNASSNLKSDNTAAINFVNAGIKSASDPYLMMLAFSIAYYLGKIRGVMTNVPATFGEDSSIYKSSACSLALLSTYGIMPVEGQGAECGLEKVKEDRYVFGQNRSFLKMVLPPLRLIGDAAIEKFETALMNCPLIYTFILKADGSIRTNVPTGKEEMSVSKVPNEDGDFASDEMIATPSKASKAEYKKMIKDMFAITAASQVVDALSSNIIFAINRDWCIGPTAEDIVLHHAINELPQLFMLQK